MRCSGDNVCSHQSKSGWYMKAFELQWNYSRWIKVVQKPGRVLIDPVATGTAVFQFPSHIWWDTEDTMQGFLEARQLGLYSCTGP